jgi:hypothetical protein
VVATARDITYTLRFDITLTCAPEQSIFDCAIAAENCMLDGSDIQPVFDPLTSRCVDEAAESGKDGTPLVLITVTTAVGCALLLLAAVGILLFYQKVRASVSLDTPYLLSDAILLVKVDLPLTLTSNVRGSAYTVNLFICFAMARPPTGHAVSSNQAGAASAGGEPHFGDHR